MTGPNELEQLAGVFPDLPLACGNRLGPGVIDSPDFRDWSQLSATRDQCRIEHFIDRYDLRQARVLHVGIGSSVLAQRLHTRCGEIVGTSIDQPEIDRALSLGLPNYRAVLHNKYSAKEPLNGVRYDFIVDNNLTSMCCCLSHFADLIELYRKLLTPGGQIVTDKIGLGWITPEAFHPRWAFSIGDLAAAVEPFGMKLWRRTRFVHVLALQKPRSPGLRPTLKHVRRRIPRMVSRVPFHVRRVLVRH